MANFSLRNFRTEIARRGLAKPTRFEVNIPTPLALSSVFTSQENRIVNLFCESSGLPPQVVGVKQQRIYGPSYQRPFSIEYGGEGLPMSFYLDQQMDIKAFFDAWISKIVDPQQYFVYYQNEYAVNIEMYQLDELNRYTYSVALEDAFPRSVTMIELNHSSQNQTHRLNVNFAFRRWRPTHRLTQKVPYPSVFNKTDPRAESYPVQNWNISTRPIGSDPSQNTALSTPETVND